MSRDQEWIDDKNIELDFISSFVGSPFSPHNDITLFSQQKNELKNKLIQKILPPPELSMTNMKSNHGFEVGSFKGTYLYARNGFSLNNTQNNSILWGSLALKKHTPHISLLGACQGFFPVITKLLSNKFEKCNFIYSQNGYYETRGFFDSLKQFDEPKSTVVIIDSSSNETFDEKTLNCADAIIFDSTCINLGHKSFNIIEKFLAKNTPIFIVRSHQKLDALGLEPSAFGTVVSLLPEGWEDFPRILANELSWSSMHAQPRDIFPWLNDKSFIALSNKRNDRIRSSYKIYQEKLNSYTCQWFEHELFFKFPISLPKDEHSKQIIKFCLLNKPYVQNWASFGLEACALVVAPSPKDSTIWRFSPGDLPASIHSQVADSLVQFLNAKF